MNKIQRARALYRELGDRIENLMLLSNGEYMDQSVIRVVLHSNADIANKYEIWSYRRDVLKRYLWGR